MDPIAVLCMTRPAPPPFFFLMVNLPLISYPVIITPTLNQSDSSCLKLKDRAEQILPGETMECVVMLHGLV